MQTGETTANIANSRYSWPNGESLGVNTSAPAAPTPEDFDSKRELGENLSSPSTRSFLAGKLTESTNNTSVSFMSKISGLFISLFSNLKNIFV